jgi:acyl carrier protein
MTYEQIQTTVHEFVSQNFVLNDKHKLDDNQSFVESGMIDSTGILELISFLEQKFNVKFADNELTGDNFDTVNRIASFISGKLAKPSE